MTPEQIQQYRDLLAKGRFDPDKQSVDYAWQRGHNEGIEFALAILKQILGEG